MNKTLFRQGEVFLQKISKKDLPKNLKQKDNVLASGSSWHAHTLDQNSKVFTDNKNQYVTTAKPSMLSHLEHAALQIPKGTYKVTIQREYDILRDEVRAVRD